VQINPGEPLKLGYILDLSGGAAFIGNDTLVGLQIALERAGKILGHDVILMGEDEGCDAEKGRAAGQKLAGEDQLLAVLGTTCSRAAISAFPWLSEAGMVMISPSNTAAKMFIEPNGQLRYPGYFRVIYSDSQHGSRAAQMAIEKLQAKKAAAISSPDLLPIQEAFVDEFTLLGGKVSLKITLNNPDGLPGLLSSIAADAPDLVYLTIGDTNLAGQLLTLARQTPGLENMRFVAYENLNTAEMDNLAGLAADGLLISFYRLEILDFRYADEILSAYRQKTGADPVEVYHVYAIDAVDLLLNALNQVSALYPDGTLYIQRQALRDALYATQDFQGFSGAMTCNPFGDCGAQTLIMFVEYHYGVYPPMFFWP
jgi:branched-chain amino acid transport system substrate-binding protein